MMARFAVLLLTVLAGLALWTAARREPDPAEQARDIAAVLRCPDCAGVSAAESSSAMALSVRAEIERLLRAGHAPEDIVGRFRQRYGDWILLSPPVSGIPVVLWALPTAAVATAVLLAVRRPPRLSSRGRRSCTAPAPDAAARPVIVLAALALAAGGAVAWASGGTAERMTADQPAEPLARGRVLASTGDHEGAVRAYREALRRRPDDRTALCLLGLQLIETGRAAEALSLLQPVVTGSHFRDADLLLVLGTAQLTTEPAQGRRTLARFLAVAPAGHPALPRIREYLR
ncbi:cytochrome c-type biogenesis protein CcmH [Nonomuraea sp. NPDC049504]|uniref:cytochrome c-type biogenesis protein CcmH n=1 Tax=Nonomuraea sp. NPDC049504 TaxID=3154729 RepID=UPI00344A46A1